MEQQQVVRQREFNPKEIVIYLQEKDLAYFISAPWMNKNIEDSDCHKRGDMPLYGTTFIIETRSDLFFVRKILSALGYQTHKPCIHNSGLDCRNEEFQLMSNYPFSRVSYEGGYHVLENDTPTFNGPKQTDLDLKIEEINKKLDKLAEGYSELDDIISAPYGARANRLANQLPLLHNDEQILPKSEESLSLVLEF